MHYFKMPNLYSFKVDETVLRLLEHVALESTLTRKIFNSSSKNDFSGK